ncbi:NUDIX domain-containing protein [Kitasatospora sp. NPDC048540]|uniref:NUDIX hydrolase n=1 Tax=Kitasatospora sp. NPDC048540 TaxID=3155634 RepID=UPI0033D2F115
MPVIRRRAARVLLLDGADRVLLLHGSDPAVPDDKWWITPGGGVEPGEDLETAALRELAEELGPFEVRLGPLVAYGTTAFSYQGQHFEQEQWFHLARTSRTDLGLARSGEEEHATLLGVRWWTLAELRATDEVVYPAGLAGLLEHLFTAGPPDQPVRL